MTTTRANQLLHLWERHQNIRRALKSAPKRLLDQPLTRWIRATDRGIPSELARRPVGSLLEENFDDLVAAPGIGVAKLTMLLSLMERVKEGEPAAVESATDWRRATNVPAATRSGGISAAQQWADDVKAIHAFGLENLPLGRLAASLAELPRTMWGTPLGQFTSLSFDALQAMPYFGKRRVEAVVRIVADAARLARAAGSGGIGGINWHAHAIQTADAWIREQFALPATSEQPTSEEVRRGFVAPLLTQIEADIGARAVAVMEYQFAVFAAETASAGVRKPRPTAEVAALSRPRLHQIKEDVRHACYVRWPDGGGLLASLAEAAARRPGDGSGARLLQALGELLFVEAATPIVRIAPFSTPQASARSARGAS
jgi:hypothetical protein